MNPDYKNMTASELESAINREEISSKDLFNLREAHPSDECIDIIDQEIFFRGLDI